MRSYAAEFTKFAILNGARAFALLVGMALLGMSDHAFFGSAIAQPQKDFPDRPLRIIVPYSAGGGTDLVARLVAPKLSEALGKQVIVDNRPGADSAIGTEMVAKAAPDGYTLLLSDTRLGIAPALYAKLNYDAERDFAAVSQITSVPSALVVHPGLPVRSVKDLVALAKARPGELTFGTGGVGTPVHMAAELLKLTARIDIAHIPYKGVGPALIDLMGGHFHLMFPAFPVVLPYAGGKLRVLALTSEKRSPRLPETPTMGEAGFPGVTQLSWFGLHAPAATPKAVVDRLYAETARLLQDPSLKERFASEGLTPVGSSPEEFSRFVAGEISRWKRVVKDGKIKLDP